MTVKVHQIATGEVFNIEATNVEQLKKAITQEKGIPAYHQAILTPKGKLMDNEDLLEEGSSVQLSMGLNGGCGLGCNLCGAGAGCRCEIL